MAPNNDQNDNASTKTDQKPESDQSHGGEGNNDEEQQGGPPAAVGFWDPRLKHVRKEAFFKWTLTTGFLMVFIMAALSIYWAAQFYVERNMHSLRVYVVDFDGQTEPFNTSGVQPLVGPAITNLVQQMIESPMPRLGWTVPSPSEFNFDPIQVRQAVYDFKAWAAIVISPNATAMLRSAVTNGNASYDPMGACQIIYNQARQETTWANYLAPQLSALETQATSMIGMKWTQMVMQNATTDQSLLQNVARVPQALSPAIGFSRFNLRPFYPYQAVPSVSIGLIYLIILSFFSFAFYLPIHFKYLKPEGHPPLKFWQLIIWRWLSTISAYFMLSLAYSLVSLAFQINFSGTDYPVSPTEPSMSGPGYSNPDAYGHGTFPVYWMINFFGMIALGLACENVAMIVGQPWTGLWLIFWVITNVSTSFYIIDVEPGFYRWGYAWPLHYVVEGSRQVLFDLHSRIGMDFGILIAWGAVNTLVFPFACYFMRWKSQHHVHEYYK